MTCLMPMLLVCALGFACVEAAGHFEAFLMFDHVCIFCFLKVFDECSARVFTLCDHILLSIF